MALTPGQQACVDALVGPVAVSAGAGSGKTFTLTKRIVHAIESGFVSDVDEVLAITFTSKAAGEIKSRVKGALRAAGRVDQALKVDGAWISTIHGMCARMLRAHALELGIDPSFKVIGEADAKTMLDASLEEVLGRASDFVSPGGLDALFGEYSARSTGGFGSDSVESMVRKLVEQANAEPDGVVSFVLPPEGEGPHKLLVRLMDEATALAGFTELQKPGKTRDAFIDGTQSALERAEAALSSAELTARELVRIVSLFPCPTKAFGTAEYKDRATDALAVYQSCAFEARLAVARPLLNDLLTLADLVLDAFRRRKREAGVLDNDNLLVRAARAFDECPTVAESYADAFKLIMVDEFQDTSQMQVDLIKRLAGSNFERLCTVGDAQQSIYRFRGADVSVYNRHLGTVREQNPAGLIELADNFRSHADVLSFVDRVFSQQTVFGSSFMSLAPGRDEARVREPFDPETSGPRIEVQLTAYQGSTSKKKGVSGDEARRIAARRIAARFAELAAAGHSAGEMAVLLGGMSNSDVYADALRAAGLPCVVTGGSIFNRAPEVQLMVRLAQMIANPQDTEVLFEVLSSELFALSADDLLALATRTDEERGVPVRRALNRGFDDLTQRVEAGEPVSPALACAVRIFADCCRNVERVPVSDLLMRVVVDSGWLARLESQGAEGQARAANVYKAIRLTRAVERETGAGPAGVAAALALRVEIAKEAPGALAASGGAFVRIMTVHASKGLEFPIVAVAELRNDKASSGKLVMSTVAGRTYLSLDVSHAVSGYGDSSIITKCAKYQPYAETPEDELPAAVEHASCASDLRAAVKLNEAAGESAESRRLLYVALTRAKEALVVSMLGKSTSNDPTGLSKSCTGDIQSALVGLGNVIEPGTTNIDFGGSTKARVIREDLLRADVEAEGEKGESEACDVTTASPSAAECESPRASLSAAECETPFASPRATEGEGSQTDLFDVPVVPDHEAREDVPFAPVREGVFSYSSIAPDHDSTSGSPAANVAAFDDDDAAWAAICASLNDADAATNLGTAFHRLAQIAVLDRREGGRLARPSASREQALARSCHLSESQRVRLSAALDRWFASDLAARASAHRGVCAEVPFFVKVPGAGALEGEIDLFATDGATEAHSESALIVDYKTGGNPDETPEQLHAKHELQATCYAYAVLNQGYRTVEATFVRVEQPDEADPTQPQQVTYRFTQDDLPTLEATIRAAANAR